jgi:hypothetical protein
LTHVEPKPAAPDVTPPTPPSKPLGETNGGALTSPESPAAPGMTVPVTPALPDAPSACHRDSDDVHAPSVAPSPKNAIADPRFLLRSLRIVSAFRWTTMITRDRPAVP